MLKLGEWQELVVIREKDFGIYLASKEEAEESVLLPKKQVPQGTKKGDTIKVFIYKDSEDRMIATVHEPKLTLGEISRLKVSGVTGIGAFMDWGLEKDILLPFKEQTCKVIVGQEYLVRMYIDKSERLAVSMRLYGHLREDGIYEEGQEFSGTVYEVKPDLGAFVAVDDKYSGMIPKTELYDKIKVGQQVHGRVLSIREDGKLNLSLRKPAYLQMDEDGEKVLQVMDAFDGELPFTDKADPEIIKREFGLSKNAFKRAVGRLMKEGKVEIMDKSIRRIK